MNTIIKTIYQNITHSHIVEGIGMNEIQKIFSPESLTPNSDTTNDANFGLVAHLEYNTMPFKITSDYSRIIDFYEWLRSLKSQFPQNLNILSINSIHNPLEEENMKKLLTQLEEKYAVKKATVTPQLLQLAQSLSQDTKDFVVRYNGYADPGELDLIQSRSNDLQVFIQQGQLEEAKKRMNQLLERMELIENTYVKKINLDEEKPLEVFNKELNTIMSQNRLSRYQGLNKLSGGSSFDYFVYKLRSSVRSWFSSWGKNTHLIMETIEKFFQNLSKILIFGCILALVVMFWYQRFINFSVHFDYILWGTIGLVFLLIHWVGEKTKLYIASTLFFLILAYLFYLLLKINF